MSPADGDNGLIGGRRVGDTSEHGSWILGHKCEVELV